MGEFDDIIGRTHRKLDAEATQTEAAQIAQRAVEAEERVRRLAHAKRMHETHAFGRAAAQALIEADIPPKSYLYKGGVARFTSMSGRGKRLGWLARRSYQRELDKGHWSGWILGQEFKREELRRSIIGYYDEDIPPLYLCVAFLCRASTDIKTFKSSLSAWPPYPEIKSPDETGITYFDNAPYLRPYLSCPDMLVPTANEPRPEVPWRDIPNHFKDPARQRLDNPDYPFAGKELELQESIARLLIEHNLA